MASVQYTHPKALFMQGSIDMDTGGDTFTARLIMNATTCDTEEDVTTFGAFTTDDESDDGSYTKQTMTTQSVSEDTTNNQGEFHTDNVSFTLAGDGSRDYRGS